MSLSSELKFKECDGCINHEFDPFRCGDCRNGDLFEGSGDIEQELTYHEFIDFHREFPND